MQCICLHIYNIIRPCRFSTFNLLLFLKYYFLIGGPTLPTINPCKPLFQCKSNKKCIPRNQVCDFGIDCPDGEDESNVTCGYPQGFDTGGGYGGWKNSVEGDYEFVLYRELKNKLLGAPTIDARGDVNGKK